MSQQDVRKLLSSPLSEYPVQEKGLIGWSYSDRSTDNHYRVRVVLFDIDGVVERKSYYYVD